MPAVARRRRRMVVLTAALLGGFVLVYLLRSAIFPFVLGLVLAHVLLPVVSWTEGRLPRQDRWLRGRRASATALVFIAFFAVAGALLFYMVTALVHTVTTLMQHAPEYTASAISGLSGMAAWWNGILPEQLHPQADYMLDQIGDVMGQAARDTFMKGLALIPPSIGFVMGLAALPVFLFYTLKDWAKLRSGFYSSMPSWAAEHVRNVLAIAGGVLGRFIRAQLLLCLVVGCASLIGLVVIGAPFAPVLAFIAGTTELIPLVGPWIGGITAVIVTLAVSPERAVWVALLAAGVQVLENAFLAPRIQGGSLNIHLAVAIVLLVLGAYVAGFWGLVLVLPLTAVVVQLYRYFYRESQEDVS